MSWIDDRLWELLDPNSYAQRMPIEGMRNDTRLLNIAKDINSNGALSNNVEDRRNGISEQDRIRDLRAEDNDRVRRAMGNSLLNRPQNETDAWLSNPDDLGLGPRMPPPDDMTIAMMNALRRNSNNGK